MRVQDSLLSSDSSLYKLFFVQGIVSLSERRGFAVSVRCLVYHRDAKGKRLAEP